ncbi:MAG: tetratricopeptide repeat protein [Acidobacteria bacterium]|nr:tetratricopeptide repeat protein [Acidobacteriota bacterium]
MRAALLALALLPLWLPTSARAQTLSLDLRGLALPEAVEADLRRALDDAQWPRAEALLYGLAQTETPSARLLEALGAVHLQCGRYLQAATAYRRADRLEPLRPAARLALAKAYLGLQKRHWARREIERLAREEPRNPLYAEALAGIFQDYQWFDLAAEQARRAIELAPDSASPYDRLGQALEGRNQMPGALDAYRTAVEKDRRGSRPSAGPGYRLGRLLLETGRPGDAAQALQAALAIDPGHADAAYEWGMALRRLERWPEAARALERAAELAPRDARIPYALSQVYRRLGRMDEARQAVERFRALSPP